MRPVHQLANKPSRIYVLDHFWVRFAGIISTAPAAPAPIPPPPINRKSANRTQTQPKPMNRSCLSAIFAIFSPLCLRPENAPSSQITNKPYDIYEIGHFWVRFALSHSSPRPAPAPQPRTAGIMCAQNEPRPALKNWKNASYPPVSATPGPRRRSPATGERRRWTGRRGRGFSNL